MNKNNHGMHMHPENDISLYDTRCIVYFIFVYIILYNSIILYTIQSDSHNHKPPFF